MLVLLAGCRSPQTNETPLGDPRAGEVRLTAGGGFDAYLVHSGEVGIWTVRCLPIFERYGCQEIVALDDLGRCIVLNSYSGKWTPWIAAMDGLWLGGIAHADVDPRRPGPELYVGGKRGNLYQIEPVAQSGFNSNIIAYLPGREIHTLVAVRTDPATDRSQLYAFTRPGGLYRLTPDEGPGTAFTAELIEELPGRVRDAVVLPACAGRPPAVVTVARTGEAEQWHFETDPPAHAPIYQTDNGLGRIAVNPHASGDPLVLYVTVDDGRIVRLERQPNGAFADEIMYAGPAGPRGVAAGRFYADPAIESVAIFGYAREVQLLTRVGDDWRVETIFEETDKGHCLALAEVDGRNATDELILSGYAGRVVLLARPPGYGR